MQSLVALIALAAYVSAEGGANGVATFNNYAAQGNTVCGPKSATVGGAYGAALGDLSPLWYGQKCAGDSSNMSECTLVNEGKYQGPYCPKTFCNNKCFSACNEGPIGGEGKGISANGKCIKVQIIDVCPSESADNYCKTSVPANERCGAPGVNALDIDISAYQALTGQEYNSDMPNLNINVTPISC